MLEVIAVFLGGGLGSVLRYGVGHLLPRDVGGFHWATFSANIAGALMIGFLFHMVMKLEPHGAVRAGIITGFLGGLTTFSTFSLELFDLLREERFAQACLYGALSLLLGLLACAAGWFLAREMFGP